MSEYLQHLYTICDSLILVRFRALVSSIVLTSTKSTGGKFDVEGKTSNGLIDINFGKTPAESDLKLQATSYVNSYVFVSY